MSFNESQFLLCRKLHCFCLEKEEYNNRRITPLRATTLKTLTKNKNKYKCNSGWRMKGNKNEEQVRRDSVFKNINGFKFFYFYFFIIF